MSPQPATPAPARIDWRTVLMLLPRRRFTAEELARAIPNPISRSVSLSVALNLAVPTIAIAISFGRQNPWYVPALIVGVMVVVAVIGLHTWSNPTSRMARASYWGVPLLNLAIALPLTRDPAVTREAAVALAMLMLISALGLWFTIVHRHQYVSLRLAELAERERAVEMARRLAAAQLEPHFLFNTLASVQHWVQTGDARAAPLLASLTGYLRATLPMFTRATQPLAAEAAAVRRYLEVMAARLGPRLTWSIELDDAALGPLELPPGLLLTLVENAVVHGIEPQIAGGHVHLQARADGAEALIEVVDNGVGCIDNPADGLGLANCRERLALTLGPSARLSLGPGLPRGCRAEVRIALRHDRGPAA